VALTGNTVQSTYLDLVQLEKSGAGLPSHAGKEAAVYDGSGAQILGRTAVRHWLDPHPDAAAFAETWEFSTTGDMTKAQLETAGWTFVECADAYVQNGILWLEANASFTGTNWPYAMISTTLAGDFDLMTLPVWSASYAKGPIGVGRATQHVIGGVGVGDTSGGELQHCYSMTSLDRTYSLNKRDGTIATGSGTETTVTTYRSMPTVRLSRISGAVKQTVGEPLLNAEVPLTTNAFGWATPRSFADATSFDRIILSTADIQASAVVSGKTGFLFLRRFA